MFLNILLDILFYVNLGFWVLIVLAPLTKFCINLDLR